MHLAFSYIPQSFYRFHRMPNPGSEVCAALSVLVV